MILKSLSRKGGAGAFTQLYDYISAKAHDDRIWHNFFDYQPNRSDTIQQFQENSQFIRHTPRHNICYHEILSVKRDQSRGKDYERRQIQALRDLTGQYLSTRARNKLAYAALHLDQSESIHVHMMISSNGLESERRVRLAKHEFLNIQKQLEQRLQERYPELEERTIYNKPWEQSQNLSDREQAMKKRTGAPSKKDLLKEQLQQAFSQAKTQEEAQAILQEQGIRLTQKGKNITASQHKLKCRLKTLGIHEAYENIGREVETPEPEYQWERSRERNSGGRER